MSDLDIEYADGCCSKCGHEPIYRKDCTNCDDGYHDLYDEDDVDECDQCNGRGGHVWCPKCGYDLLEDPEKLMVNEGEH